MKRQQAKIIQIPTNSTASTMTTALNNALANGWELKQIFLLGTNTYAVLIRIEAE